MKIILCTNKLLKKIIFSKTQLNYYMKLIYLKIKAI